MAVLHDETRARWEGYSPQRFIREVINGALREKITIAYTAVHVYTQVVHRLPATTSVRLSTGAESGEDNTVRLRDLFISIRASATRMYDIIEASSETLPLDYTYRTYIQQIVGALREHTAQILRWTEAIRQDDNTDLVELRHMNGKSVQAIAVDITRHVQEITYLLNFTSEYASKLTRSV